MEQNKITTSTFKEQSDTSKSTCKDQEELPNYISPESYKDSKILEIQDIPLFNDNLFEKLEKKPIYSRRKIIDDILKNEKPLSDYLEKLLQYDDTYDKIQSLYLDELIKKINSKNNNEDKINIIIEKIQKASIILSQDEYEKKIKLLDIKNESLNYINYKKNVIEAFEYLLTLQNKTRGKNNVIRAKNILNIKKNFQFGREPELGDNNYYFYKLAIRFYNIMVDLFISFDFFDYFYFIKKILEILKESNLEESLKKNKFKYRYLINIIFDRDLINNNGDYEKVVNFIEGKDYDFNELKEKVNKIKNEQFKYTNDAIKYDIDLDESENKIHYTIEDKTRIGNNSYIKIYKREFNLRWFNKGILEILNDNLIYFENQIFSAIKLNEEYSSGYYSPFKNAFNVIIENILKSKAAVKYFNKYYKNKYKNLSYHFNDDDVIKEILDRITFAPIFGEKVNAYTDGVDLSITINSIPGKCGDKTTNIYNKKILELGRIILFAVHEILGHYLRRYYHYLTHGKISFYTKEDKKIITGKEGGFFVEEEFLGFDSDSKSCLTISNALCLLYWDKFKDYPIKKNNNFAINKEVLENIVTKNKEVFDFIGEGSTQIKFEDYLTFLTPVDTYNIPRNCFPKEDFIYLKD